jgi:hypothetical protein
MPNSFAHAAGQLDELERATVRAVADALEATWSQVLPDWIARTCACSARSMVAI